MINSFRATITAVVLAVAGGVVASNLEEAPRMLSLEECALYRGGQNPTDIFGEDCDGLESCTDTNGGSHFCQGIKQNGVCTPAVSACNPNPACTNLSSYTRCTFAFFSDCERITQVTVDCGNSYLGQCFAGAPKCICVNTGAELAPCTNNILSHECI